MKHDTSQMIKREEHLPVILIGEGLLVGMIGGLIVLAYRIALKYAGKWMDEIITFAGQSPVRMAGWLLVLMVLAVLVGLLVRWEPMISGSGIPQLEGEMAGKLSQKWWRVLPAKICRRIFVTAGGIIAWKGRPVDPAWSNDGKRDFKTVKAGSDGRKVSVDLWGERRLSAAFDAPLAGVMFSLEEVHKKFLGICADFGDDRIDYCRLYFFSVYRDRTGISV